ncbi:MAG: hypothetical protein U1F55_07195 [Chitinivorax sp.]
MEDICKLFACERLTLYAISRERNVLYSRVKTGINSNKDLVLPLSCDSIAGFVALKQQVVNIGNVYDALQLSLISPELHFFASGIRQKLLRNEADARGADHRS